MDGINNDRITPYFNNSLSQKKIKKKIGLFDEYFTNYNNRYNINDNPELIEILRVKYVLIPQVSVNFEISLSLKFDINLVFHL